MNQSKKFWIGFDLGGTKMLSAAYDSEMKQLGREKKRTRASEGADAIVERIIDAISKTIDKSERGQGDLLGIGIGVPGPIDLETGTVIEAPNLGWKNVRLQKILEDKFDTRVVLCNDVDAGIYGEYVAGAAKGAYSAVGIFPGTGVGGGCVLNGQILQGKRRTAMEVGHIPFYSGGPLDGAGNEGTLECVASRLAISAGAAQAVFRGTAPYLKKEAGSDLSEIRSGTLANSIKNGDKSVERLVRHSAEYIGKAMVTLIHILSPEVIVLGGGLVEAIPDLFVNESRAYAIEHVLSSYRDTFDVAAAELGDDSTIIGAAAWIMKVCEKAN